MDTIKSVPRRIYFLLALVLEMIILFFNSIFYMGKAS